MDEKLNAREKPSEVPLHLRKNASKAKALRSASAKLGQQVRADLDLDSDLSQMNYRTALKLTFKKFGIKQAPLCRRIQAMLEQGKIKKSVTESQLSDYLNYKHDLYTEATETIVRCLDPIPRAFYFGLIQSAIGLDRSRE